MALSLPPSDETTSGFTEPGEKSRVSDRLPCFFVLEGTDLGKLIQIPGGESVAGRSEMGGIVLQDPGISRKHFQVTRVGTTCVLEDLGSLNGTYVNGQRIARCPLKDGDKVQAGKLVLRLSLMDAAEIYSHEQLRTMVTRDGLTELYNRAHFLDLLRKEFSFAGRSKSKLSLIFLDLDDFKMINDTHGHDAGDVVLKIMAREMAGMVRAYDSPCRYGGEEFAILLRECTLENGKLFANRTLQKLAGLTISVPVLGSDEEKVIRVTASAGVSSFPEDNPATAEDLIRIADGRVYEAKKAGKNCVRPA